MGLEKELRANEIVWLKKETYNTIVDRINNPRTYGTTQARGSKRQIDVRNASNEIIPLYGVVEVKEPTITPTDDQDRFNVAAVYFCYEPPSTPESSEPILPTFGIVQRELPVEEDGAGGGVVAQVVTRGFATAIVDVKDVDHKFCKISGTNKFHLESSNIPGPIQLHFAEEVADEQYCKVFITGPITATVPIKAPEGGIPGRAGGEVNSAECEILTTLPNLTVGYREIVTTEETIEVYNQVTVPVLDNGERYGMATLHADGLWWAIVGDCNDEIN